MSTNADAASVLRDIADLLREQKANPYRVNAYRRAANTLEALDRPLEGIVAFPYVEPGRHVVSMRLVLRLERDGVVTDALLEWQ